MHIYHPFSLSLLTHTLSLFLNRSLWPEATRQAPTRYADFVDDARLAIARVCAGLEDGPLAWVELYNGREGMVACVPLDTTWQASLMWVLCPDIALPVWVLCDL